MTIRNFVHRGVEILFLEDSTKGIPAAAADKLRTTLTFLQDMESTDELRAFPL